MRSASTPDEVDLVLVGGGAGSLVAGLAAADAGLSVALLEKSDRVGGGAAYSGGVIWAPMNHIMRRKEIPDSLDEAMLYLSHASHGRGDTAVQRAYVETIGPVLEYVEDQTGMKFIVWPGQPDYYPALPGAKLEGRTVLPHPASIGKRLSAAEDEYADMRNVRFSPHLAFVKDIQRLLSGRPISDAWLGGRALLGGLWRTYLERGLPYALNAPVRELVMEHGRVTGVVADIGGRRRTVHARGGVLLNTGGFEWNREMNTRYLPIPEVHAFTPPVNTGDGHVMAMQLGAATALMDQAQWDPTIRIPGETHDGEDLYLMFLEPLSRPHSMVVNRAGRRFGNESSHFCFTDEWMRYDSRTRKYMNFPAYLITDSQYRRKYGFPNDSGKGPVPSWITQALTLEELAERCGIDAAGLSVQVATFNVDAAAGTDEQFGRGSDAYDRYWGDPQHVPNPVLGEISEPPYYAIELHLGTAGNRGGLVIDGAGRVISVTDQPIPGLYACGHTAADLVFGGGYNSGTAIGSAMAFGYLAARDVANNGAPTAAAAGIHSQPQTG
ncbi:FAD-dependent oxidoreductase [Mycobacterium branderi]|nr:FAD-dependent oxidoreductase [Mycobacterium branderi]MCV7231884.1 FAD-binding protein [Mycobacterium branderi]